MKKLLMIYNVRPNDKGFFTEDMIKLIGLPIIVKGAPKDAEFYTFTKVQRDFKELNAKLTQQLLDKYCIGFMNKKGMRGYSPVFDPSILFDFL